MKVTVLSPSRDSCFDDESSEDTARGEWWTAKAAPLVVVARRRFDEQDDDDDGTRAKTIAANAIIAKIIVENNMVGSIGTRFYLHSLLCCVTCGCSSYCWVARKTKKAQKAKKRSKMGVRLFGRQTSSHRPTSLYSQYVRFCQKSCCQCQKQLLSTNETRRNFRCLARSTVRRSWNECLRDQHT